MPQEKCVHVFNYIILVVKCLLHYAESESKKSRRSPSPSPEHPPGPAGHSPSNSNLNRRRLDSLSEPIFGKQFCDV